MYIDKKFIKFIFVGMLNTLFGYLIFALFLFTGIHYSISVVLATVIGILFNFKTTGIIVFKSHDNGLLFKFILNYCITMLISIVLLYIAERLNLNLYIASFAVTVCMAVLSFCILKYYVFKGKQ